MTSLNHVMYWLALLHDLQEEGRSRAKYYRYSFDNNAEQAIISQLKKGQLNMLQEILFSQIFRKFPEKHNFQYCTPVTLKKIWSTSDAFLRTFYYFQKTE